MYWAEALGGPGEYSNVYGDETSVVKMHSGNGEPRDMDDRAIACFEQALVVERTPAVRLLDYARASPSA